MLIENKSTERVANEMKTEMERLKRFLKGYESEPEPQEIDKISGDFQLAGLKPLIDHIIREKKIKKVIDLGCGNAILLKCLMKDIGIQYLGVDTKDAIKGAFSTILELDVSEIILSAKEYNLPEYLMLNKGIVLSREKIENHIWNFEYEGGTNVVDVYISYVRKI